MVEQALAIDDDAPEPAELFRRVIGRRRVAFLDGRGAHARAARSHLAWEPIRELRVEADESVRVDGHSLAGDGPLAAIDDFLAGESAAGRTVVGVLGYELTHTIEPRALGRLRTRLPIAVLASYARALTYDHRRRAWLDPLPDVDPREAAACRVVDLRPAVGEKRYRRLFERARDWIAAGDVYQVNLSIRFDAAVDGEPAALYERLAARQPVPFGAYLDCGNFQVLSNSPELFLARRGGAIETRPIKGTRPRGTSPAEDARLRQELCASAKDRAEHVMIVDLERSDLGRVATTASVRVAELGTLASYSTLHHLESTVAAIVPTDCRFSDLLRATFPGGSITGAPKIRAVQIIDELEEESREIYTGAVLYYPPGGDFTMSLAIRTATVADGRLRYSAGGGLVWDSTAATEYAECLLKAQALFDAVRSG